MADIEGGFSYEGTNDINMLVVRQAVTGIKACAAGPTEAPRRSRQVSARPDRNRDRVADGSFRRRGDYVIYR
jgi:hypothetical protein